MTNPNVPMNTVNISREGWKGWGKMDKILHNMGTNGTLDNTLTRCEESMR